MNEYQYPIDYEYWSTEEIIDVVNFYRLIENAYESGVKRDELLKAYRQFKKVVDSIAEEKQYDKQFKEMSGYSIYKVIKTVKEGTKEFIKIK